MNAVVRLEVEFSSEESDVSGVGSACPHTDIEQNLRLLSVCRHPQFNPQIRILRLKQQRQLSVRTGHLRWVRALGARHDIDKPDLSVCLTHEEQFPAAIRIRRSEEQEVPGNSQVRRVRTTDTRVNTQSIILQKVLQK